MSLIHEPFLILDRSEKRVIYEADSLSQARGYCDASDQFCMVATVAEISCTEWKYRTGDGSALTRSVLSSDGSRATIRVVRGAANRS